MISKRYSLTTGYSIMADPSNQFHHMPTEERLYLDPHNKSIRTSTKYSSLLGFLCLCPDISRQFYAKTNTTQNIFSLLRHKQIMYKTDYYFGDAWTVTIRTKVTNKIRQTKAFWMDVVPALTAVCWFSTQIQCALVWEHQHVIHLCCPHHGGSFFTFQICTGHTDRGHLFPKW